MTVAIDRFSDLVASNRGRQRSRMRPVCCCAVKGRETRYRPFDFRAAIWFSAQPGSRSRCAKMLYQSSSLRGAKRALPMTAVLRREPD
jgi:hypothetical protein